MLSLHLSHRLGKKYSNWELGLSLMKIILCTISIQRSIFECNESINFDIVAPAYPVVKLEGSVSPCLDAF